jgi:hypothetical protein
MSTTSNFVQRILAFILPTVGIFFWFEFYIQLQRLSIINATWAAIDSEATQPLSQGKLVKMVQNHPTLCWLRSDLTDENIAMLQQKRPEFTFVSK